MARIYPPGSLDSQFSYRYVHTYVLPEHVYVPGIHPSSHPGGGVGGAAGGGVSGDGVGGGVSGDGVGGGGASLHTPFVHPYGHNVPVV